MFHEKENSNIGHGLFGIAMGWKLEALFVKNNLLS